jgi:hypothetical protein
MTDSTHEQERASRETLPDLRYDGALPSISGAEREFWRRAVAAERARQRCGRPAPFPFQES